MVVDQIARDLTGEEKMRMKDKVVLVTGKAAGIGKATALRFSDKGARAIICDVNEEAGNVTVKELSEGAAFYKVNVAVHDEVQKWIDNVVEKYDCLDVMISNAGILRDGQLVKVKNDELVEQMFEENFDLVISINFKGVFNCAQAVAPIKNKQGGGVILNATSVVGLEGNFGQTNYVATKSDVIGMTKVWARELGRHGVRVNAVAPGLTATEIPVSMPEKIIDGMKARTPLGRLGETRDIANAYLFLASDEAAFITGETLRVDGGIVVGT